MLVDPLSPGLPTQLSEGAVLLTAEDSAAAYAYWSSQPNREAGSRTFSIAAASEVTVKAGDVVVVTVASASSGRCESVSVTGAISASLFSGIGACGSGGLSDGVGQTTTIGPASAGGTLVFRISSPRSVYRVSGTYPNFTVELDDGLYDHDYNDVVLTVSVRSDCPPDPSLSDPDVLAGLRTMWDLSYADAPFQDRRERVGFIVEKDGNYDLVQVYVSSDPCTATITGAPPRGTVAVVHTHPLAPGTVIPPGTCAGVDSWSKIRRGPSTEDLETLQYYEEEYFQRPIDGLILDANGVTRFDLRDPRGQDYPKCKLHK